MQDKKRILLTTSAAPSQSPFSTSEKRPPLGIGYLISVLRNAGHEVFFIDNYLSPSQFLETDYLQRNRIDFVGIYANTICFRDTLRMVFKLNYLRHSKEWKGKIIVGGPHTGVAPETIPFFVDYVVQGEGERAILDIVEGKINTRMVRYPPIENLDELPMPSWDYFIPLPYKWTVDWFEKQPVFTMNTSRGCPFQCTFCSVGSIWGKKYTYFSAERVVSEIEYLVQHYGAKGIYFREDNFTLNKKRLESFCNLIINKDLKIHWACESRVDTLDEEVLKLMYQAGARAFYFGVESGSQKILDFLKKGIRIEQVKKVFKLCREIGFKTAASVIHGVPSETEEDLQKTEELLKEINPDLTWRNVFVGIPNSDLYQYALENNLHEFIDDRGLVYLKGHNQRVKRYYGTTWDAAIPVSLDQPKISVIMSAYNCGEFLACAIKSILNQTYPNFEFIIVNDGSTDDTEKKLESFRDPRIKIVQNPENLGLTKSLNKGIRLARGEYLARMDADDLSYPHRFEIQLKFLENFKDYALVGSSYYQLDKSGEKKALIEVLTEDARIREGLRQQNWFGHGSVMMRKDAVQEAGGYDERFKFAQDYDLWLRLSERYKVANIDEPLYGWRMTRGGISQQKAEEQKYYAKMAIFEAEKRKGSKFSIRRENPMVSVIVPTYNRPETLAETLKSVLQQSYQNFEIVVVNDAGPAVEKVIDDLNENQNIYYLKHDRNRGLAAGRNTGLKLARGKYISYLDDDDLLLTDHLETLVRYLENHEERVAYTDAYRAFQEKIDGRYVVTKRDVPYSFDFDYDRILGDNFIPVHCVMHAKSCLETVGFFDESLKKLEDWDLWIRMSRKFQFVHIKKVTCEFAWRNDGSTMTSGKWPEFQEARKKISAKFQNEIKKTFPSHTYSKPSQNCVPSLVSIIILTYNQKRYTKECLDSIRKHTPEPHELIFIDNGSTDGTVQKLRKLIKENPNYKLVENHNNLGFAKGCNQGIAAAGGEYLLLLNNDVVVTPNWLSGMRECLNRNPNIGIVGPMTNQISGIQKIPGVPYPSLNHLDEFACSFHEKNRHRQIPSRRIVGFCMLFRKELVERIGLLDESFGTGNFEDDDFCLRAELEGFSNVIAGDVFIHHYGSRSFVGNQIDYRSSMGGNRKIFLDKWKGIDYKSPLARKLLSLQEKEEAWKFYHQDQLEKAADKFLTALKISPQDEAIYLSFGEMLIDAKRYQEAFDILEQLPPEKRNDQIYARLGYCLEGLGRIAEAEEFAEKSLSVKPGNAMALNLKGTVAYRRGQKEEAAGVFQKAIQADPGYGEPCTNLGVMKWEAGEREAALNFLERGFILSPTGTDNLQLYHSAVSETGAFERAGKFLVEAESLHPTHKKIQYLLVDVLLRQEKNEAAMERIESSIGHFGMDDGMMKAALEVRKKIGAKEIPEKGEKGTVSLCMIVKDEEKHLAKCLQSAKTIVDEMIVVDTGSSDRTKELATIFGAKVFDFAWENDFSSARNDSLSKASGDWILVLDADEMISEKDHHFLCNLRQKKNGHPRAFSFVTRNYVNRMDLIGFTPNDGSYPEEEGAGWTPSEKVRLFPNDRRSCFENPVHEMIRPALEKNRVPIQKCPVPVHHYGKLDSEREKEKGERYYALGRKKLELHSDLSSLTELAIQAGALGHFDEAISLWNQVLVLDPKMTDAYINLSYNHLKLRKYTEAAQLAQRARELDPDSKEGLLNYSSAEFYCGNIERVVASLEDFLPRCLEYPPILGLLSLAYFLEGKIEKGLPLVEKLKRIGFDYKEYVLNSAQDLIAAGQEKKAAKLIEITKKSHKQPLRNAEMGIG